MIKGKKSKLAKRYQASYQSKDSDNGGKVGVMDWKKIDREISFFSPIEGRNRINIIPYEIKTKNHPLVKRGEFEVGDLDYLMDFFVHRNVGPSESSVVCLKNTFGKPCPICEQSALLRKQGKEQEANELKASRRVIYNVQDLKDPDKVKVFETSHFLFEKELIDESRDEEGGFVDFADPVDGKEIKFRCQEVQKGAMKFKEYKSFSFEDRDEEIDDDLLEQAISFDEVIRVPTYEEVEKILYGSEDEDDEEPKKKKVEEDDSDDEEEIELPKKKAKKVVEEDDEEEVEESPKKKKSFEDLDDVDEEEEEEEKPKKSSGGKCPFGHKFGVDCDEHNDCDNCDKWDSCFKANN